MSGGQTGVDRAALDWALRHGIAHGGWCPKGRRASDGRIPDHYNLRETQSEGYRQRTRLNVQEADATLVLNHGALDGGTLQTVRFALSLKKAHLVIQLDHEDSADAASKLAAWLQQCRFRSLNIAGPREEKCPGIYAAASQILDRSLLLLH